MTFVRLSDGPPVEWDVRPDPPLCLASLPPRWRSAALRTGDPARQPHHVLTLAPTDPLLPLLEAADPRTPGERLRELVEASWVKLHLSGPLTVIDRSLIHDTALANPSLPLDVLRSALRSVGVSWQPIAWRNPAVPALLLSEPLPEYRRAAAWTLHASNAHRGQPLEALVAFWASRRRSDLTPRDARTYDLARHLAGLFDLPWP